MVVVIGVKLVEVDVVVTSEDAVPVLLLMLPPLGTPCRQDSVLFVMVIEMVGAELPLFPEPNAGGIRG